MEPVRRDLLLFRKHFRLISLKQYYGNNLFDFSYLIGWSLLKWVLIGDAFLWKRLISWLIAITIVNLTWGWTGWKRRHHKRIIIRYIFTTLTWTKQLRCVPYKMYASQKDIKWPITPRRQKSTSLPARSWQAAHDSWSSFFYLFFKSVYAYHNYNRELSYQA